MTGPNCRRPNDLYFCWIDALEGIGVHRDGIVVRSEERMGQDLMMISELRGERGCVSCATRFAVAADISRARSCHAA